MQYRLAPLFCRPWALNGITPRLIESHYETNYGSAVCHLNVVTEELQALDPATAPIESMSRLKRDQPAALNSTLLHELYFASLGGDGRAVPETMAILALDMYEHAYHIGFGSNAKAYVAAFMRNIAWNAVQDRYEDAVKVAPPRPLVQKEFADVPAIGVEELQAMIDRGTPVQIIDARPRHYTTRSHEIMEGAVWRDPERLDDWIGEISKEQPVVTYCVYGFHIGCQTAIALRKAGYDARYMAGGHFAWKAVGGKVRRLEE